MLSALDEDAVRRGVQRLKKLGVRSIAVMYLFSFVNPQHERRTREIVLEEFPDVDHISLSHEVHSAWARVRTRVDHPRERVRRATDRALHQPAPG